MKWLRFLICFSIFSSITYRLLGQNAEDSLYITQTQAEFQGGGLDKFVQFINGIVKFPENAKNEEIDGKVIVSFRIDSLGNLVDIQILKSLRNDFDKEVIKALQQSPKWTTAKIDNLPVSQRFVIPIKFYNRLKTKPRK